MRIGMIGTRFAGLDGVTLESRKIAQVLAGLGNEVCWFGGRLEGDFSPGREDERAFFDTTENGELNRRIFGVAECSAESLELVETRAGLLQSALSRFVSEFGVELLMPQNALAIPMQVPLGVAIARLARSESIPVLAHHHDFAWERERFWPNGIGGYLEEAFPAVGPEFSHLVINTLARDALHDRTGAQASVLPNIMDFANPPRDGDGGLFRRNAGIDDDRPLILQPTRMVPRKRIEDTIALAAHLADLSPCVVVTHPEPDEGSDYLTELAERAVHLGVDFRIVPAVPAAALADAYAAADLVAYPSRIEGFGNALLEAIYYRRPILVNRYPVYVADIAATGLEAIEMDGFLSDEVVATARRWIEQPDRWAGAVERNYERAERHFSYEVAAEILAAAMADALE
ncbi:MAG: glycosyltransferase family 4 protein [Acidimicrobiia bacterium]|nr:glycosyltransferase family 4 protein [Acidimicrobiia bacterium]